MTANTQAILNQLKDNPEFLSEVCESMSDAVCQLVIMADMETDDDKTEIISIASKLSVDRMDIRKMIR